MAEPRIFHLLHLCHRAVFRAADKALNERYGITAAQHAALMYLAEHEGASMGDLAGAVGLKAAATSGLVDRMERNGFLERRPAPHDGRSVELHLKAAGRDIVANAKHIFNTTNAYMLDGYSPEETQKFADFLTTITKRATEFSSKEILPTEGRKDD